MTIAGVEKQFGRFAALKGVDLDIAPGELLALLGPSGSGKTTLLRIIAGLEFPGAGRVCFDADEVTFAHAAQRGVGFVFQQYALFKHMTVAKNVAFGLDVKARAVRPDHAARKARVAELLKLVELEGFADRYPAQLSGGQRQRVALARALAVSPRILLLDEPFGALDATVRKTLRRELRRIHETTGLTTVFVTHDQEEALDLADRVALLSGGKIEQIGLPQALIDHPSSAFVAGFVGQSSRLSGRVEGEVFLIGAAALPASGVADGPATAFVRADQLAPTREAGLPVVLKRVTPRGPLLWLDCEDERGQVLEAAVIRAGAGDLTPGARINLALLGGHVFPRVEG
ncbi:MAG: sulfate/molybdate ABC transporter ATP-binding protein [Caulobacteraceae bacterium]